MKTAIKLIFPLAMILINAGCTHDYDNISTGITVKVTVLEIGNSVDNVKLTLDTSPKVTYAETEIVNDSFEFILEKEVEEGYLQPLSSIKDFKNMSFSDTSAKACCGTFDAYRNGRGIGNFVCTDGSVMVGRDFSNSISYIYVDRDVEMTGIHISTNAIMANCFFKKGWNLLADIDVVTMSEGEATKKERTYTTDIPSGSKIKWCYVPLPGL